MKMINNKGVSLVELVITAAILSVLASLILPSAKLVAQRNKEIELRRNLREIRTAIDKYHEAFMEARKANKGIAFDPADPKSSGYPEDLQILVTGRDFEMEAGKKFEKFLRRIPIDPFNPPAPGEDPKWGYIGYADHFDTPPRESPEDVDGGVFDVVSLSEGQAIDGTKYSEW